MGEVLRRRDAEELRGPRHEGRLRALPGGAADARSRQLVSKNEGRAAAALRRSGLEVPADQLSWLSGVVLTPAALTQAADQLLDELTPNAVADLVATMPTRAAVSWMRECGVVVHKRPGVWQVRDAARVLRTSLRQGDLRLLDGLLGPALDTALAVLASDDLVAALAAGARTPIGVESGLPDAPETWQSEIVEAYEALPPSARRAVLLATISAAGPPAMPTSVVLEAAVAAYALAAWEGTVSPELVAVVACAVGLVEELDAEPSVEAAPNLPPAPDDELQAELDGTQRERETAERLAAYLKNELTSAREQARKATDDADKERRRLRRELEASETQLRKTSAELAELRSTDDVLLRLQAEEQVEQLRNDLQALQDEYDDLLSRLLRAQTQRVQSQTAPETRDESDSEAETLPEVTTCAGSVELAQRLFPQVELVIQPEPVQELDQYGERARPWAGKTLLVLGALQDYVEVKRDGFEGDFSTYLRNTPPGRRNIPVGWYAAGDSAPRAEHRAARTFAVPYWFNGGGPVYFAAHVRLDLGGRPAPRLHLYDDTGGPTGTVWVGYLGKHLPNGEKP
jgi:hypothetical protein